MALRIEKLKRRMNKDFVLSVDEFEIKCGICGIIGNNGAGKTTLLSLLAGLRLADFGKVYYENQHLNKDNLDWWKQHLGVFLDESFLFEYFTPIEHCQFIWSAWPDTDGDFRS